MALEWPQSLRHFLLRCNAAAYRLHESHKIMTAYLLFCCCNVPWSATEIHELTRVNLVDGGEMV